MFTNLRLLSILLTFLPFILAQEWPVAPPANIHINPPNKSPDNSMMTGNQDWHDHMALALTTSAVDFLNKWGSFDVEFKGGAQFYTINLYKYNEGGYKSPSDCYNACSEWLGQAMQAGMQDFQCDHYGGGKTHCWLGYGPKVHQKAKRESIEWKA
ncbi:MAG: hypothetical protein M1812_001737 [Candelaria pacifica]|nr:MAG: hypothetical protein M1812_001737 [Candelaria pacifica]